MARNCPAGNFLHLRSPRPDFLLFQHGVRVPNTRQNLLSRDVVVVLVENFVDREPLSQES